MWASTSISPIFHLKNVSGRETASYIYILDGPPAIVSVADKNSIFKFNETNEAIKHAKYHIVFFSLVRFFKHSPLFFPLFTSTRNEFFPDKISGLTQ